ncbi:MAG: hypothetical protein E7425_14360 [Ruminococcaceae bacterium]|nr:hypothetical protein [Oscillospiraceae bacterium]
MYVYLFELDSVRNSEAEAAAGQRTLFREIVANGNTVVLSYNQLSDSAAFWAALKNEESYDAVMELCRLGMIQVSLFAGQRTAAQYILTHVESCMRRLEKRRGGERADEQGFYFSLVPLDDGDGELLDDVFHAIQYSDVQLLREKAREHSESAEKYLFLYRYVELILMLSRSETANHPQKPEASKSLSYYLDEVRLLFPGTDDGTGIDAVLRCGIEVLRRVSAEICTEDRQRRSVWYQLLEAEPYTREVCAAEAIIDLCYNYAVEDSISGVDKRYADGDAEDFRRQFRADMERYWNSAESGRHVFHWKDDVRKNAQTDFSRNVALPDWTTALRLVRRNVAFARKRGEHIAPEVPGKSRAERRANQKRQWARLTKRSRRSDLLAAALYAAAFVVVSYLLNGLQELVTGSLEAGIGLWGRLLLDFISVAVFGLISSVLFTRFGLPDILETVESVKNGVREREMLAALEKGSPIRKGGTL